jgi:adenylate cyclase
VRLDPTLELPEYRDNFENRLILLKRRLAERAAPIHIEKTGRGRFRLDVMAHLHLESSDHGERLR